METTSSRRSGRCAEIPSGPCGRRRRARRSIRRVRPRAGEDALGRILPGQPVVHGEGPDVDARRRPCSAAAARPCRGPFPGSRPSGKTSSLRFSPTIARWSPVDRHAALRLVRRLDVHHLLALAGVGDHFLLRRRRSRCPDARRAAACAPGRGRRPSTMSWSFSMSTMMRIGSPWPRPPGSSVGAERVELAAGGEDQDLVGGLRREGELQLSPSLKVSAERSLRDGPSAPGSSPSPRRRR